MCDKRYLGETKINTLDLATQNIIYQYITSFTKVIFLKEQVSNILK